MGLEYTGRLHRISLVSGSNAANRNRHRSDELQAHGGLWRAVVFAGNFSVSRADFVFAYDRHGARDGRDGRADLWLPAAQVQQAISGHSRGCHGSTDLQISACQYGERRHGRGGLFDALSSSARTIASRTAGASIARRSSGGSRRLHIAGVFPAGSRWSDCAVVLLPDDFPSMDDQYRGSAACRDIWDDADLVISLGGVIVAIMPILLLPGYARQCAAGFRSFLGASGSDGNIPLARHNDDKCALRCVAYSDGAAGPAQISCRRTADLRGSCDRHIGRRGTCDVARFSHPLSLFVAASLCRIAHCNDEPDCVHACRSSLAHLRLYSWFWIWR
jgi:hypothetical protein